MPFSKSMFVAPVFGLLFLTTMPFAAQWDDFVYTESSDSITITDYAGSGAAVVIPETIGSKTVTAIGFVAFFNCTDLTSLTLPGSITRIEPQAFSGCTGLTSLTIPDSVTSIGAEAFSYCTGLTSLTIPGSVTSIGPEAFSNCAHLTDIEVDAENPSYSSLDGVLYNKAGTVLIQYPAGRSGEFTIPGSVTSIGGNAFFGCADLTEISIPGSVKSIGDYAFFGCTGLTAAYFYGNAPVMGSEVFKNCAGSFTVCHTAGSIGFTNPWCGYPSADCSPPLGGGGGFPVTTTTTTIVKTAATTTTTTITSGPCPAQKVLGMNNPALENLRALRDGFLAKNALGHGITKSYYNNARWINGVLDRSPALRAMARKCFEFIASLAGKGKLSSSVNGIKQSESSSMLVFQR